ncbi:MAG: trypsin-like peptidase domain-containing protein [Sphingomonadales bacterium]|nr:trypsin-like peptidase domain-containing protein [Sphingomonadales bacterium]
MMRLLAALLLLLAIITPARADDIADSYGGVGRILVVLSWKDGDEYVGFGSGFAVTPTRIVTNYHVIEAWARYAESADEALLAVVPSRGSAMIEARLVTYDSAKDLAVLELQGGTMEPMTLFSGRPDLGRRYTALGFPSNVDFASSRSVDELFDLTVTPRSPIRTGGDISEARPVCGIDAYVHDAEACSSSAISAARRSAPGSRASH